MNTGLGILLLVIGVGLAIFIILPSIILGIKKLFRIKWEWLNDYRDYMAGSAVLIGIITIIIAIIYLWDKSLGG